MAVFHSKKVVISEAYLIPDDNANEATKEENEIFADWFSDFIDPNEVPFEPGKHLALSSMHSVTCRLSRMYRASPPPVLLLCSF